MGEEMEMIGAIGNMWNIYRLIVSADQWKPHVSKMVSVQEYAPYVKTFGDALPALVKKSWNS